MTTEPSDILKVLRMCAEEYGDSTCHSLLRHAERGENILSICHEAIRLLAAEKAAARDRAKRALETMVPRLMITSEEAERMGLNKPQS